MDTESIERLEKQAEILTAAVKLLTMVVEDRTERMHA